MTEDKISRLEARVSVLETNDAVQEVHRESVLNRLGSIEDTLKWLVRLILGAFLLAIIDFATSGGFIP